mgnify:CR=1 FL=1
MDPEREALYETCSRLGVAITVMKAFGGGDLLDEELSPAGKALTVNQCLHYALTRPGVAAVMSGAHTVDELEKCLEYTTAADVEKDYAAAFCRFTENQLGRALHVLRTLCSLSAGNRCGSSN